MTEDDRLEKTSARKRRAALASTAASLALALAKLAAGALAGSLALISEGAHNALDIGVSALTYFAVREADKPADEDHPFGHAKIEAVAALAQTGFLLALAVAVAFEALRRLSEPEAHVDANVFAFAAIVVSIAVDLTRWRTLRRIASETGSDALAADALHFSSDLVSSVLVLAGLGASRLGFAHADLSRPSASPFSLRSRAFGWGAARSTRCWTRRRRAWRRKCATRSSRPRNFRRRFPAPSPQRRPDRRRSRHVRLAHVASGARRRDQIRFGRGARLALAEDAPDHYRQSARARRREILERVQLIASRRRLFVHHVAVQHIGERDFGDARSRGRWTHEPGRSARDREQAGDSIANELGSGIEVETHIEPMEISELDGRDADAADRADGEIRRSAAPRRGRGSVERYPRRPSARRRAADISEYFIAASRPRPASKPHMPKSTRWNAPYGANFPKFSA